MVENLPASAGNLCSISALGRSPGYGNGTPLRYSCLENPTDRGAWWAVVHGVTELDTAEHGAQGNPSHMLQLKSFRAPVAISSPVCSS